MSKRISRRQLVTRAGVLAVGLTLGPALVETRFGSVILANGADLGVDSWLVVNANNTITIFSDKLELGTGVQTALSQIAAEELYLTVSAVQFVQGDTNQTSLLSWDIGYTAGSQTIQRGGVALRQGSATAFQWLLQQAATRLNVSTSMLQAGGGKIGIGPNQTRALTYGALIGGNTINLTSTSSVPVRNPNTYTIVGQSVARVDLPDKFTGRFEFVQDVRVPSMLHGRVVRPSGRNATFVSYDDSAAQAVPDYLQTVQKGNFIGVVARTEWGAIQAAKALKVTWSPGPALPSQNTLQQTLRTTPNATKSTLQSGGSVTTGLSSATQQVTATYFSPFNMHGAVGPSCGVADVQTNALGQVTSATIWSGTQGPFPLQGAVAQLLGTAPTNVRVIYVEASGCYGHNGADDAAADAALLSWAAGQPVRVQWMRADEHNWEPLGPAMVHDMTGGLDGSGNVVAWQHTLWTPTHSTRPANNAGNLWAGQETGFSASPTVSTVNSGGRNAPINYSFSNNLTTAFGVPSYSVSGSVITYTLLRSTAMRSLGGISNTFANESFVDELAHAAGIDPLTFRLNAVPDARGVAVLKAMATQAGWGNPFSHTQNGLAAGRGIAYLQYENSLAYVAAYAEALVNTTSGAVTVSRVVIAHDCGQIINPNGLKNQIEGNAIQATSRALFEEVNFNSLGVTNTSWQNAFNPGGYRILHFDEMPKSVEIVLIDQPNLAPWGAGEPVTEIMPAVIGNAVFDAVGARLRTMPFTPARVLAAISSAT